MKIPQFLIQRFKGYEILDFKEWISQGYLEIILDQVETRPGQCWRCGCKLDSIVSRHRISLEEMPIFHFKTLVRLWRRKGHCPQCQKLRSERISFISPESPHLTAEYGYWLGRLCEFAPISRVAKISQMEAMTLWRHDFNRMKRMLQSYRIPPPQYISVDEVYARKRSKPGDQSNADKFFTVISDLKTRKVIWVASSKRREALDEFFNILGEEGCKQIKAIVMDQHADYAASAKDHIPHATLVLDRFHLTQDFEEAINETRKELFEEFKDDPVVQKNARGAHRFIFLEKASRRSKEEQSIVDEVARRNHRFLRLELIKERLLDLFNQPTAQKGREVFDEVGDWIWQMNFGPLKKWHKWIEERWDTVANYFELRITTGLSEANNNVIKALKRRAFGYKNMDYFRLKIMQVCGYLNSSFVPLDYSTT